MVNQIEGAILPSASWTLYESVSFESTRITSTDWSTYPILRFGTVPDSIEMHVINRPGERFLGADEAGQGPAPQPSPMRSLRLEVKDSAICP